MEGSGSRIWDCYLAFAVGEENSTPRLTCRSKITEVTEVREAPGEIHSDQIPIKGAIV